MSLPVMVVTFVICSVAALGLIGYLIDKSADGKKD